MAGFAKTIAVLIAITGTLTGCTGCGPAAVETVSPVVIIEEPDVEYGSCSGHVGEHPCNFDFLDQNGEVWDLWNHSGTVMVIDFSTEWCSACRSLAPHAQGYQDSYTSLGYDFLWVTVLVADESNDTVELDEARAWSVTYGMTSSPVLAGDRSVIDLTAENGIPISGWPTFVVIDKEMTITFGQRGWSESDISNAVDSALGL